MAERQYSDEEVAAIFEQASRTEQTALPVAAEGEGLTLAALQSIGHEVGISPEAISRAALSLDQARGSSSRTFLGLPVGVRRTVEFDRPLADSDWERLVTDLRETFEARGTLRYDGTFRQWTNGNLQALVEPIPKGHRLRLQTLNDASRGWMTGGLAALGGAVVTAMSLVAGGLSNAGSVTGTALMAVAGLGMFATGALRTRTWARRRRTQFEEIAARLETAVTARPPESNTGEDPRSTS